MSQSTVSPTATKSEPVAANIDAKAAQEQLQQLVQQTRTLILGTTDKEGLPNASYTPFVDDEAGNFYIYVSALAQHTRNLRHQEVMSAMVIEDEATAGSIYARRRATWNCRVEKVERDSDEFSARLDAFEERFGDIIDALRGMQDFQLFRLTPEQGRVVLGFGAAFEANGFEVHEQVRGRHSPAK